MGFLLFTLYTTPLSSVIANHNIHHNLYADDTQVYISFSVKDAQQSLEQLKACLLDIFKWMTDAKLKLNPEKNRVSCHWVSDSKGQNIKLIPVFLSGSGNKPI